MNRSIVDCQYYWHNIINIKYHNHNLVSFSDILVHLYLPKTLILRSNSNLLGLYAHGNKHIAYHAWSNAQIKQSNGKKYCKYVLVLEKNQAVPLILCLIDKKEGLFILSQNY